MTKDPCDLCRHSDVGYHKEPCSSCHFYSAFECSLDSDIAELRAKLSSLQAVACVVINNAHDRLGDGLYWVPKDYVDQLKRALAESEK